MMKEVVSAARRDGVIAGARGYVICKLASVIKPVSFVIPLYPFARIAFPRLAQV
jgi:hypothetical protein